MFVFVLVLVLFPVRVVLFLVLVVLVFVVLFLVLVFVSFLVLVVSVLVVVLFPFVVLRLFLVVLVLVVVMRILVVVHVHHAPEFQVRGQVDDEPRLRARDQVTQEVRFEPGTVDEDHGCIGRLPGVPRGRLERVRVGTVRQHHVQGHALAAHPGDDVADDVGGRHDRQAIRRRLLHLALGKGQRAGQRQDGNDGRPHFQLSHDADGNDNSLSLQATRLPGSHWSRSSLFSTASHVSIESALSHHDLIPETTAFINERQRLPTPTRSTG